ncbi:hypothetical protein PR048_029329 [Dryococelus australis]|uniref:PHD-type domain-containing protein n=1 Tax=Dryococelus australis TaxID=614101 RepID=A0ABQ9GD34_9NEOP|nr:hypothetical protein PR048_029329 [Dryococelus australis]
MQQEDVANAENVNDSNHSNDPVMERKRRILRRTRVNNEKKTKRTSNKGKGKPDVKGTGERQDTAPRDTKDGKTIIKPQGSKGNPSTGGMNVTNDSWYCSVCEIDEVAEIILCNTCLKYFHERCVGITKRDNIDMWEWFNYIGSD